MSVFYRASSPLRKCINFTKPTLFSRVYTFISRLHYIKVRHDHRLFSLYHSVTQIQRTPGFSLPRLDYTIKQDVAKTNWMITKLCKEGRISEARKLFDEMPDPDVISWTALISGYIKCGALKEARELFDRVDAKKNVVTWTAMISGYVKMKRIFEAERLFEEMPEKNVISWNTMIDGYVQSDRIEKALGLFERMDERNVVSWNTLIAGLVNYGRMKDARDLFDRMPQRDVISWTIMISGLAREGRVEEARVLFDTMPERNVVSWNAMITGYTQNMRLDEAFDLFKRMPEKDVPSWNTMIAGFIQNKDLERARKLFNEMPRKNVVSWTAMINGYVQDGQSEEALRTFFHMKKDSRVNPNEATFVSVLGACSDLAGLGEGRQVHQVISKAVYQESEFVISALINMYSKCGELMMARNMFEDGLKGKRDLVSWNTMIAAYSHHGCGREAITVFKEMHNIGIKPNDATYVGLLSACSHAGLVEQGLEYFDTLLRDECIEVRDDHYTCLVDLCGRAGRLKEAYDLVEQLPNKVSAGVWGALLAGCNIHGDEDVGKLAAIKLLDMEPENAGTYMLLSNIYASSGKWQEAAFQRLKMKEKRLKKQPGCSWIEVGNRFHVFLVGDKSHTESKIMRLLLLNLHKKMKKMGSIPLHDLTMEDGI